MTLQNGKPRARETGLEFGWMQPGPFNAITDVPGVRVGQVTLKNEDTGPHAMRTGVTAVLPHEGNIYREKLVAAVHTINGHGKVTGFEQVRELGVLETPILLTSTLCVGRAWDAVVTWLLERNPEIGVRGVSVNPVVAECSDAWLNDLRARYVHEEHVQQALDTAQSGPVEEGGVGAGTGMTCYEFKGGIGTASRLVDAGDSRYTLGILALTNFGAREQLIVAGKPVGQQLKTWLPDARADHDRFFHHGPREVKPGSGGSVILILATDAPLTSRQLGRLARRTAHGLARTGATANHSSGDFAIAFSTAQRIPQWPESKRLTLEYLVETELNPFFQAVVESTEEAVINSLYQAVTLTGRDGHTAYAYPIPGFS